MPEPPAPPPPVLRQRVSRLDLFAAFAKVGLIGFGGVAPYARRVIVEERGWLGEEDYAEVLGFGQTLPGANTVNAAVIIGDRFQGASGALVAVLALLAGPLVILVGVALLYDRLAHLAPVQGALAGVASGAAGLVIGTGLKMGRRLRADPTGLLLAAAALVAVAVLKAPLVAVVLGLAPLGLAVRGWRARA
jgi:chromate transporter